MKKPITLQSHASIPVTTATEVRETSEKKMHDHLNLATDSLAAEIARHRNDAGRDYNNLRADMSDYHVDSLEVLCKIKESCHATNVALAWIVIAAIASFALHTLLHL